MQPLIVPATRFRYALPILAELERSRGAKFISLTHRLEASDRAVRQALDWLIELGWVRRNTGYGHPSRPEYLISDEGEIYARRAVRIEDELRAWSEQRLARERWPLAVVISIGRGEKRFGEMTRTLATITPRALTETLRNLQSAGVVDRRVEPGHPPAAIYRLTPWGLKLFSQSVD